LDLHLFTDAQGRWAQVRLHSRSLWQAKVAPGGEEWQVAVVDNLFGPEGPVAAKFLLLRPWAVRTNRVSFYDPTFGMVPFPSHLFWLGRPFQLERRFETDGESPVCKLEFTPQQPPLTELKLSGEFVCMQTWEAWERNRVRRFDSFGRCPVFSRCCFRGWWCLACSHCRRTALGGHGGFGRRWWSWLCSALVWERLLMLPIMKASAFRPRRRALRPSGWRRGGWWEQAWRDDAGRSA
jgi:hypothetical protein